jgi:hypothetical protein
MKREQLPLLDEIFFMSRLHYYCDSPVASELMINDINDAECDATDDATATTVRFKKISIFDREIQLTIP